MVLFHEIYLRIAPLLVVAIWLLVGFNPNIPDGQAWIIVVGSTIILLGSSVILAVRADYKHEKVNSR